MKTAGIVTSIPILASSFLDTLSREYIRVIGGVPIGVMNDSERIRATGSTSRRTSTLMETARAIRIGMNIAALAVLFRKLEIATIMNPMTRIIASNGSP